jgi:predicted nucleotide-binding protein
MARKVSPPPPQEKSMTPQAMRAGITRFERRLKEIENFNPLEIKDRQDPRIETLEAAIAASLDDTFGEGTQAHNRYGAARYIDTAGINMNGTPYHEVIEGLSQGKQRASALLTEAIRYLEERIGDTLAESESSAFGAPAPEPQKLSDDIFVVHGRDEAAKEHVARVIQRAGLNPVILHEQPNSGKTIIEKFEKHGSAAGFAVIIATPDDIGGLAVPAPDQPKLSPRARQNVIGEMFWFAGRLGRDKVCALVKGHIEMPTDFAGVVYTPMDEHGGWKSKLLQELAAAGYKKLDWQTALA